jgi:hypothetical protein
MFNITHWPYVHSETTTDCVKGFFSDSFRNLNGDVEKIGNGARKMIGGFYAISLIYLLF